ncbi:MAG TPA: Smr/MutS family protein [Acidobacteriaceae bacterium]|nr:Smr/MutS family protein [Acidobacteriaceae bacterium]
MLPHIPNPLQHTSAEALEFPRLRELVAGYASTAPGRAWTLRLEASGDQAWASLEQQRVAECFRLIQRGHSFDFHGLVDPAELLERASITGAVLEAEQVRTLAALAGRFHSFQQWARHIPVAAMSRTAGERPENESPPPDGSIFELATPLLQASFAELLGAVDGKFEADGSLADHASPELARIRRRIEQKQRSIEDSLRGMLRRLGGEGSLQQDLITIRGERFVLPVKAEWKRRVPGVVHGASSSGQTFFIEPMESIEANNDLQRLLEEEQEEIQRVLAAMTRQIARHSDIIARCAAILTEIESFFARARFAQDYACVAPILHSSGTAQLVLKAARHPLLEQRLRGESRTSSQGANSPAIVPLDLEMSAAAPQLIISGPNTGGKTVVLKTVGLFALMAQSGIPVPAEALELPVFDAILADIGDSQSIAQNLSTFSAHIARLKAILGWASASSLVLLDELGSATDPEEGAALAAAIAGRFAERGAWSLISTHHTSMKVYAANTPGVQNAAAGFEEETFAPTYKIRVGVPGVSAGIHIAQRLGLEANIITDARERLGKQTEEIGRFLDKLHADLLAVNTERTELHRQQTELLRERHKLEREGLQEQQRKVEAMEGKLASLLKSFEYQTREALRGIEDKAARQKVSKLADRGMAKLRREFRQQIDATVLAHRTGADRGDPNAQPHLVRNVGVGDTIQLRSLGKPAVVQRQLDSDSFEVTAGALKMRIPRSDIAQVIAPAAERMRSAVQETVSRGKGIRVARAHSETAIATELKVIGRNVEEAIDEVEKFVDAASLEGLPRVRVVHGSGMGILRRALREYLTKHPSVSRVTEPPHNEGGAGATIVELRQ